MKPDPEIEAVVKGYEDKLSKELDIEIGVTETPLDSRRATVRGGEAAIGNLVADALKASVGRRCRDHQWRRPARRQAI